MKQVFTLTFFALSSLWLSAQTLSYSRVILVESAVQTVPAGHVWKVERAVSQSANQVNTAGWASVPTPTATFTIQINGISINISEVNASTLAPFNTGQPSYTTTSIDQNTFPLWLPPGTTLAAGNNVRYISVIEFRENP
jgi:hypothetical protein